MRGLNIVRVDLTLEQTYQYKESSFLLADRKKCKKKSVDIQNSLKAYACFGKRDSQAYATTS